MPNAFSPNDDGKNDSFKPLMKCTGNLTYVFKVFNRWGEIVFESNSPAESWNGKYKGEPVPLGVYVYYLQYSCDNCDEFLKGNVTLVR